MVELSEEWKSYAEKSRDEIRSWRRKIYKCLAIVRVHPLCECTIASHADSRFFWSPRWASAKYSIYIIFVFTQCYSHTCAGIYSVFHSRARESSCIYCNSNMDSAYTQACKQCTRWIRWLCIFEKNKSDKQYFQARLFNDVGLTGLSTDVSKVTLRIYASNIVYIDVTAAE